MLPPSLSKSAGEGDARGGGGGTARLHPRGRVARRGGAIARKHTHTSAGAIDASVSAIDPPPPHRPASRTEALAPFHRSPRPQFARIPPRHTPRPASSLLCCKYSGISCVAGLPGYGRRPHWPLRCRAGRPAAWQRSAVCCMTMTGFMAVLPRALRCAHVAIAASPARNTSDSKPRLCIRRRRFSNAPGRIHCRKVRAWVWTGASRLFQNEGLGLRYGPMFRWSFGNEGSFLINPASPTVFCN